MERIVDYGERIVVTLLCAAFLLRVAPVALSDPWIGGLLAGELLTTILILIRKPGAMATSPYVVAIAFVGTAAPLLVTASTPSGFGIGDIMMVGGFLLALSAKLALNRRFGIVPANRGVQVRGPYALVRHPMYLGYIIMQGGFLIAAPSLTNALLYAVAWTAQVLRIIEEEKFLSMDMDYRAYSAVVGRRLVPGLF